LWLVLWCGVVTSSLALQVGLPERQDVCLFNMRLILANKPCEGLPIVVVLEVQLDVLVVELEALVLCPLAVARVLVLVSQLRQVLQRYRWQTLLPRYLCQFIVIPGLV